MLGCCSSRRNDPGWSVPTKVGTYQARRSPLRQRLQRHLRHRFVDIGGIAVIAEPHR